MLLRLLLGESLNFPLTKLLTTARTRNGFCRFLQRSIDNSNLSSTVSTNRIRVISTNVIVCIVVTVNARNEIAVNGSPIEMSLCKFRHLIDVNLQATLGFKSRIFEVNLDCIAHNKSLEMSNQLAINLIGTWRTSERCIYSLFARSSELNSHEIASF